MTLRSNWAQGEQVTHTDFNELNAAVIAGNTGAAYPQTVLVSTGTEVRPTGSDVVLWLDTRGEGATRPDNMDDTTDLWFTPNGASGDTEAPSTPTGLTESAVTSDSFTITWSASTDNVAVTGYQVRLDGGTPVDEATLSHDFTGLTPETSYDVDVRARDAVGNWSAYSTPLAVVTDAASGVPDPLSRFNFNEGTGTTATSVTGGYTLTGTTPTWGSGTIETELGGYVEGAAAGLVYSEWTFAVDLVLDTLPAGERTFLWHKDTVMFLNILSDGKLKYYASPGSVEVASTLTMTTGTRRVVVTQDATTVKVYVDGTQFITNTSHHDHLRDKFTVVMSGASSGLDAGVDTLRFWNQALDAGQVSSLGA